MEQGEALVYKLLVRLQEADADVNPPAPPRRDGRVLVRKVALTRVKNARLVIHPNDHPPPHFHVEVSGDGSASAVYSIETLERLQGNLPGHLQREVLAWAVENRSFLRERWRATRTTDYTATFGTDS